jgi:hypothetical protein
MSSYSFDQNLPQPLPVVRFIRDEFLEHYDPTIEGIGPDTWV